MSDVDFALALGEPEGARIEESVDGKAVGRVDGTVVGAVEGTVDGKAVGRVDGTVVGVVEGTVDGKAVGRVDGTAVGARHAVPIELEDVISVPNCIRVTRQLSTQVILGHVESKLHSREQSQF